MPLIRTRHSPAEGCRRRGRPALVCARRSMSRPRYSRVHQTRRLQLCIICRRRDASEDQGALRQPKLQSPQQSTHLCHTPSPEASSQQQSYAFLRTPALQTGKSSFHCRRQGCLAPEQSDSHPRPPKIHAVRERRRVEGMLNAIRIEARICKNFILTPECCITSRASVIGFAMFRTAATAPASRLRPSIIIASKTT